MKELFMLLIIVPAISMQQLQYQCLTNDEKPFTNDANARNWLFRGQQQFTLNMLKKVLEMYPEENVFFSPFSVYNALLLAYFASSNQTEASIRKTLALPEGETKPHAMSAYKVEQLIQNMRATNGSESYELSSANKLFISPKQQVRDCMKDLYGDELAVTDFETNPKAAVDKINEWVAIKTKNQIKDLLNEGQINTNTQLVLANAAYFKGVWKTKFNPDATRKEVFVLSNSKLTFTTMMRQKATFNHLVSDKIGAHVLELPYKGEDVSLFIMMPPFVSKNGTAQILGRLTLDSFQEIFSLDTMIPRPVEVGIPKFTIEREMELTPILENMGIGDLFKPTSDLSALTGKPGLSLDAAVHKAKVSLDEQGTTAAAATAIFNFRSSRPLDPAQFICNHPFVYFIYDRVSQAVLFAGVYSRPEQAPKS